MYYTDQYERKICALCDVNFAKQQQLLEQQRQAELKRQQSVDPSKTAVLFLTQPTQQ